jgi:hypothetical protein
VCLLTKSTWKPCAEALGGSIAENDTPCKMTLENDTPETFREREGGGCFGQQQALRFRGSFACGTASIQGCDETSAAEFNLRLAAYAWRTKECEVAV